MSRGPWDGFDTGKPCDRRKGEKDKRGALIRRMWRHVSGVPARRFAGRVTRPTWRAPGPGSRRSIALATPRGPGDSENGMIGDLPELLTIVDHQAATKAASRSWSAAMASQDSARIRGAIPRSPRRIQQARVGHQGAPVIATSAARRPTASSACPRRSASPRKQARAMRSRPNAGTRATNQVFLPPSDRGNSAGPSGTSPIAQAERPGGWPAGSGRARRDQPPRRPAGTADRVSDSRALAHAVTAHHGHGLPLGDRQSDPEQRWLAAVAGGDVLAGSAAVKWPRPM